jgi:hypothetical protein
MDENEIPSITLQYTPLPLDQYRVSKASTLDKAKGEKILAI